MALAVQPVDACEFNCIPPGAIWYAILAALIDISNGDDVPTDVNTLMSEAACLENCIPPGLVPYQILTAIMGLSGSTGGGTIQVYIGRDPAPPDDPTKAAVSYPAGGGSLSQWNVGTAAWV
jgi:hypothetical protein